MPLLKFANADLLEAQIAVAGGGLMKSAHKAVFNYEPREGYLYVRSRAISNRTNDNYDTWPDDELRQAWSTFIGKPVFVNHHNDDVRRKRGVIIDAALHEDVGPDGRPDIWIEVLMEIDAVRFPRLAEAILNHDIERTSMGADVGESECSYCGNVATTPSTYCAHIKSFKGRRLARRNPDGTEEEVLVHEICFPPDTQVRTAEGALVPISMILPGDEVIDHMGASRRVAETMVRSFDGDLVTIQVWGHPEPIKVTSNHPVLVLKRDQTANGQIKWMSQRLASGRISPEFIPAGEITKGDFVVEVVGNQPSSLRKIVTSEWGTSLTEARPHPAESVPDRFYTPGRAWGGRQHILRSCRACGTEMDLYPSESGRLYCSGTCFGSHRLGNTIASGYGHQLPDTIELDSTFGRWCGWFLAEGSLNGPSVTFSLHADEVDHAAEIERLGEALFGLEATHRTNGRSRSVTFCSANLARFMSCLGTGFYTKGLPDEWLDAPIEFIGAVVDAHHDGDGEHGGGRSGGVQSEVIYQHATSSPRLADQLYLMHLRLGNTPTRKKPDPPGGKSRRTVPGHSIRARFDRDAKGRMKWGNWVFAVVHEVGTEPYVGNVHNLHVEGTHTYVAGNIAVHNCRKISFFENSVLVEPPADPTAVTLGVDARGLASAPGFADVRPADPITDLADDWSGDTELASDVAQRGLASTRASLASRRASSETPDLDHLGLGQLRGGVPGPSGAAASGRHVGRVVGEGAQHPVGRVVAQPVVAGVPNDQSGRNVADESFVAPTVGAHGRTAGIIQGQSPVPAVEGTAGPWPAGVRSARGVDLAQVPLQDRLGAHESPADHVGYFMPVTAKINDDAYVELTEEQKERFAGTTVRQDDDGFYCHTHRARGKSYDSIDEIPDDEVGFIESTGAAASFETEVQQEMTKMANRKKDRWRTMAKAASVTKEGVTQEESERLLDGLDEKYRSALEKFVPYTVYGPTYSRGITTNLMDAIRAARQRNDASFNYLWSKCEAGYDIEIMGGEDNWYYDSAMGQYTKRLATTAGALDHGPTEPGPRAGTRWEGIISTPNSRAYEVTVLWPGDEAPMLSGVFDSEERAREWAQKCVDAGGRNVLIENAGNFERITTASMKESARRGPNGEIMCVQDCGRPATGVYVDDRPGGFGSTYCSACVAEWERKGWGHWKKVEDIPKTSSTRLAWGETKAPPQVNTLGITECPVCGTTNQFDSAGRCMTCGHLPAPEPFREPDLEVAQKVDMRDGWVNPNLLSAPAFVPPADGGAGGEENSDGKQPPTEDADPVQKASSATEVVEGLEGDTMRPAAAIIASQEQQIARLSAENAVLRRRAGLVRTADEENPAQPVPEPAAQAPAQSTDEARAADATTEVTTPGSALTDVAPMTTTDVTTPGAAATDVAPDATQDVTAPVAGGAEMPSYEQSVTLVQPDASGASNGTDRTNAFDEDNSWVQQANAVRARTFACLRLAKLRIQAGLADGDDLVVAQQIEASRPSDDALRTEISTLSAVVQQRVASAASPRRREAARIAPSLASSGSPIVSTGSTSSFEADPVLW